MTDFSAPTEEMLADPNFLLLRDAFLLLQRLLGPNANFALYYAGVNATGDPDAFPALGLISTEGTNTPAFINYVNQVMVLSAAPANDAQPN